MNNITSENDFIDLCNSVQSDDKVETLNLEVGKEVIHNILGKSYVPYQNQNYTWSIEQPDFQRKANVHDEQYSCDMFIDILLGIYKPKLYLWYNLLTKENNLYLYDGQNKMRYLQQLMTGEIYIQLDIFEKRFKLCSQSLAHTFDALNEMKELIKNSKMGKANRISYQMLRQYPTLYKNSKSPYIIEILSSYREQAIEQFIKLNENFYSHTKWNLLYPYVCQTEFFEELNLEAFDDFVDGSELSKGFEYFATILQDKKSVGKLYEKNYEAYYKTNLLFYDINKNKMDLQNLDSKKIHDIFQMSDNNRVFHITQCNTYKNTLTNQQFIKDLKSSYEEFFNISFRHGNDIKKTNRYFYRLQKEMQKSIGEFVDKNGIPGKDMKDKYMAWIKLKNNEVALLLLFAVVFSYYYKNRHRKEISFSKVIKGFYDSYIHHFNEILLSNSDEIMSMYGDSTKQKADVILFIYNKIITNYIDMKYNSDRLFTEEQRDEYCQYYFSDLGLDLHAHNFLWYDLYLHEVYLNDVSCDHAIAFTKGGKTDFGNFIPVSPLFNSEKQDKHLCGSPKEYFEMMVIKLENLLENKEQMQANNLKENLVKISINRYESAIEKYDEKEKENNKKEA